MNYVMIDLETWGTRAGCAIRSIGAVAFDPNEAPCDVPGPTFYQNVTPESCKKFKLHIDPDTVKWWNEQSVEAQSVFEDSPVHLKTAILNFNAWFRCVNPEDIDGTQIWSHGEAFDIPIYEYAAHAVGFKAPWHYRAGRDTRTLFELAGVQTEDLPFVGTPHNALDDAVHQAKCVQLAMSRLSEWKENY